MREIGGGRCDQRSRAEKHFVDEPHRRLQKSRGELLPVFSQTACQYS
jgi:hypothetical protein